MNCSFETAPSNSEKIKARVAQEPNLSVIFLESFCTDPVVIAANIALKVSSGDPDYKDMSPEKAREDFVKRIEEYERVYETVTEKEVRGSGASYMKIINVGRQVEVSRFDQCLMFAVSLS